jgi:hypothetical protein
LNHANLDHYFELIDYRDQASEGVIAIQTAEPVTDDWATAAIAPHAPSNRSIADLGRPNFSLVCAVQVAARIVEQSLHRLAEEGFDALRERRPRLRRIPPLVHDEVVAMGRINDSLLYGGVATLVVDTDDVSIEAVIRQGGLGCLPRLWSPLRRHLRRCRPRLLSNPSILHSPVVLHINNLRTGQTFSAGESTTACCKNHSLARCRAERGGETMELAGAVVLITGGAIRLGRAHGLYLASQGAEIAFTYLPGEPWKRPRQTSSSWGCAAPPQRWICATSTPCAPGWQRPPRTLGASTC